jgi:hypothetical protein
MPRSRGKSGSSASGTQRRGIGSTLLGAWLERVSAPAAHVGVNRANIGGTRFWAGRGFAELLVSGRTLWMGRALRASIHRD